MTRPSLTVVALKDCPSVLVIELNHAERTVQAMDVEHWIRQVADQLKATGTASITLKRNWRVRLVEVDRE